MLNLEMYSQLMCKRCRWTLPYGRYLVND